MLTCRQATQLLSERQDRPLQLNEKLSLNLHTSLCTPCRRFGKHVQQLSLLAKQYRTYQSLDLPSTSADALATQSPSEGSPDSSDQTNN